MLSVIYSAMSGLQSFSKGLDVISGNVANVNTPGFKGSELLFEDVFYGYDLKGEHDGSLYGSSTGRGVEAEVTTLRFTQGDFRQTQNETDAAIDGKGFFVVQRDGEYVYTRSGQFEFDDQGLLVTRSERYPVLGLNANGELAQIDLEPLKAQPARPTTQVSFINNLSLGATQHVIGSVNIIDSLGKTVPLSVTFRNTSSTTPRSWQIEIKDAQNTVIATGGELRFQGNGSPETGYNTFKFTFTGSGGTAQNVTLYFGEPGSFSGATSFSGGTTSDLAVSKQDGFVQGSLLSTTFDDQGRLTARYTNNQSVTGMSLALAQIPNLQALRTLQGGFFHAAPGQTVDYGTAGSGALGRILPGTVELSNVELSQQFTDMIVVQRGYQASSQIMTAANEMMQQLLETARK